MAKVFGIAILLIGMIVVTALIGTLFFLAGWNWGVAPALGLRDIGLGTAFWLSLFMSTVGGMFKTTVTTKE